MKSNVIEIFDSIQGEGEFIGTLSIFIRFSGCNLKCHFCDTKYSWNEEGKYIIEDVIKYVNDNPHIKHIVITGGEPLLHQNEILEILNHIEDKVITIETNGTIIPKKELTHLMLFGLWSVSPKNDKCYIKQYDNFGNVQFKYVIEHLEQIDEIPLTKHQIFIQPNGFREDYSNACKELAEYIIEKGYQKIRVLPQFHRIMWGQKRGI